jgi:drug/metabolite transporter (DMT)-like permease
LIPASAVASRYAHRVEGPALRRAFGAFLVAFGVGFTIYRLVQRWLPSPRPLRIDKATRVFGLRFNLLVSAALCIGAGVWFFVLGRHTSVDEPDDALLPAADA